MSLLHRLTASTHRLDAAELESEVEQAAVRQAQGRRARRDDRGRRAAALGRYTPTANVPVLEAELFDGSAAIQLVWLGRRRIAGIEPGRKLLARGRVGVHDGQLAIYNPWYELQCSG